MCCTKEGLDLDDSEDDKKSKEELASQFEPLCRLMKDILGDKVRGGGGGARQGRMPWGLRPDARNALVGRGRRAAGAACALGC